MVRNVTDVDDSILPEGARARRPLPRARRGRDWRASTPTWTRSTCARRSPSRAPPSRSTASIELGRPAARRRATRTSPHGTVVLRRVDVPALRRAVALLATTRWCASPGRAAATPTTRTAATRSTSCSGSRRSPDEPAWRAPFGVGRPGWHIECSAMAMHELGPTLDLHGGGTDLIFPHHECEIAQSEALTGEPFARHWVHSAMVSYEGEKMSKSLGNLVFVSDLLKTADPRAIRLALMRHHYRAGFEWYDTDLDEGTALLHRLARRGRARRPAPIPRRSPTRVRAAIDDDLDAPQRARGARRPRRARSSPAAPTPTAPAVLRELGRAARHRPRPRPIAPTADGPNRMRRGACPLVPSPTMTRRDDHDHAARRLEHASTSRGTTAGDDRGVDRPAPRQGRARGQGRRRVGRPRPPARPRRRASRSSRPTSRRRPRGAAPLDRARDGRRPSPTCSPGAKYAIGPAIADGFYYDFELPDGAHFTDDDLERIEARDARDRQGRTSRSSARSSTYDDALDAVRRPAVQAARSSRRSAPATPTPRTRARSAATAASRVYRNVVDGERRVRRPVPRPARAVDRAARRVQAHEGRGRVLARQREAARCSSASTAPRGSRRRRSTSTCTGSRRPSSATTASSASSSTCSRSPRRSAPASRCSTRRAASSAA